MERHRGGKGVHSEERRKVWGGIGVDSEESRVLRRNGAYGDISII